MRACLLFLRSDGEIPFPESVSRGVLKSLRAPVCRARPEALWIQVRLRPP